MEIKKADVDFFVSKIEEWYVNNGRKYPWRNKSSSNYQRVVSEVLLQRTKADVVAKAYHSFFARFPGWSTLAKSSVDAIAKEIKPLGLWRRRSESLKNLALAMNKRNGRFPSERSEIEKLPGVGQYVANAVELFVFKKSRPLLDVNMARVLERYFGPRDLADIRYDSYLQDLSKRVVGTSDNPACINWAILDFSAILCKRIPQCDVCVLANDCRYYQKMINN